MAKFTSVPFINNTLTIAAAIIVIPVTVAIALIVGGISLGLGVCFYAVKLLNRLGCWMYEKYSNKKYKLPQKETPNIHNIMIHNSPQKRAPDIIISEKAPDTIIIEASFDPQPNNKEPNSKNHHTILPKLSNCICNFWNTIQAKRTGRRHPASDAQTNERSSLTRPDF